MNTISRGATYLYKKLERNDNKSECCFSAMAYAARLPHLDLVKLIKICIGLGVIVLVASLLATGSRKPLGHCLDYSVEVNSTELSGGEAAEHPRYHGPQAEHPERFTLVLNSYQRPSLLVSAIRHYSSCRSIDAIRVIWCEEGLPPTRTQSPEYYSNHKEVRYDVMPSSSLNSRFQPIEGLRTEAVLSLDDDIIAPCDALDQAFWTWRDHKRNLVGFYPRLHTQLADCSYEYHLGAGTLMWNARYSIILTKAAFFHRDYLEMYSNHMNPNITQFVDDVRNCEDIAMQFLVANVTGQAPVFVHSSRVVDLGKGIFKVKGISQGLRHRATRTQCLNVFVKLYGNMMPLRVRELSRHRHGWWLQLSPLLDTLVALFHGRL